MKTFIKWFGNKSRYNKKLISHFPSQFKTYIEPFIGSGAVFLQLQPNSWIINDINSDLIDVWLSIKNSIKIILKIIDSFSQEFLRLDKKNRLVLCRSITNKFANMRRGSTRSTYYLLMKNCVYHGSIIKNNKFYFRGLDLNFMNEKYAPFFSKPAYKEMLIELQIYLNKTNGIITHQDYKTVLQKAKNNDFVFMDPPYIETHEYDFSYNFNDYDNLPSTFISELKQQCILLDKRNVKWLMTQADTPLIRNCFNKYNISEIKIYRQARKQYTTELIIKNYD